MAQLLGPDGKPVSSRKPEPSVLTAEIAAPQLAGVRSPLGSYPADGLSPERLAALLRDADQGNALAYFELAQFMEERDPHYVGVLGTRKRIVSQTEITVESASDDAAHVKHADMVRAWLKRSTLQGELFDILDAIGKGFSFTEIIWSTSEGQWQPERLEYRDPRFFAFTQPDYDTPLLRTADGDVPLPPFKFISARMPMKSGITLRSGVARVAAWAYFFKMLAQKDWVVFLQTYGQPIRIGKYQTGATDEDKARLRAAVMNIAADCSAIIPANMGIEFIESKTADKSGKLYLERCDWLDQQVSKAVLGQTATTDAIAGGHAVGKEHREVQEDIKRADCATLSAVLNRDLIRPWIDLEYGPQKAYPTLVIREAEKADLEGLSDALSKLVPLGLRVPQNWLRDKLGIPDPGADEELLGAPAAAPEGEAGAAAGVPPQAKRGPFPPVKPKLQAADTREPDSIDAVLASAGAGLDAGTGIIIEHIRALAAESSSLEDLRVRLMAVMGDVPEAQLAAAMREALALSALAGMADATA